MTHIYTAQIGTTTITRKRFGIESTARNKHIYTVGKTGTGKSTMLRNLILQDIYAGQGVGLIDPHGDLAKEVLDHIPSYRADDVVYFNPGDLDFPIGFNLLQNVPPDQRHLVASGIVGSLKGIWRDSWGPRLEYILYASIAALLDCQNTTLLGVQRMLIEPYYRRWVIKQVKDPVVKSFWIDEFENYEPRFRREAIAPIQNKIGQLLMAAPIRNILGQVRRRFEPRYMMDHRKIFIANLSKGSLGEDKTNLLGALLVTAFQQAALSRIDSPEDDRPNFNLFVDEFSNFTTNGFSTILSEARKFGLSLVLSHQFTNQLPPEIRDSVFGNVGTLISFRVGSSDAEILHREFDEMFSPRRLTELRDHEVCVKIHSGQETPVPFFGKTFPPIGIPTSRANKIIKRCRERFATPRATIEQRLGKWMAR